MDNTNSPGEIEFNSMVAVLKRLDRITNTLNFKRQQRDMQGVLDCIIDYFKEIYPDINKETRKELWNDIEKIKTKILFKENTGWALKRLDRIDLELRDLAKEAGYLTKTAKDLGKTVVEN